MSSSFQTLVSHIFFFKNSLLKYKITTVSLLIKITVSSVPDLQISHCDFRLRSLCEACTQDLTAPRAEPGARGFFPAEREERSEVGRGAPRGRAPLVSVKTKGACPCIQSGEVPYAPCRR